MIKSSTSALGLASSIVLGHDDSLFHITISPNPANDYLTLKFRQTMGGELRVVDMQGRHQLSRVVPDGEDSLFFDTSEWPTGLYQVQLMGNGKVAAHQRFAIHH